MQLRADLEVTTKSVERTAEAVGEGGAKQGGQRSEACRGTVPASLLRVMVLH